MLGELAPNRPPPVDAFVLEPKPPEPNPEWEGHHELARDGWSGAGGLAQLDARRRKSKRGNDEFYIPEVVLGLFAPKPKPLDELPEPKPPPDPKPPKDMAIGLRLVALKVCVCCRLRTTTNS